jgi:WD40 repeat protein
MSSKMLYEAIALIRAAKLDEARRMIFDIIRNEPTNEMAWMWLAETLSSDQDRMKVLLACQMENPNSRITKMAIEKLQEKIDLETEQAVTPDPFRNGETFDPNMPERTGHTGAIIGFDGSFIVSEVADFDDVIDLRQIEDSETQQTEQDERLVAFTAGLDDTQISEEVHAEQAFLQDEDESEVEDVYPIFQEDIEPEELEFEPDLSGLFQDEETPFGLDESLRSDDLEGDEGDHLSRLFTEVDELEKDQSSDEELSAYDLGFFEDSPTQMVDRVDQTDEDIGQVKTIQEEDLVEDKVIKSGVEEFERKRKKKDRNLIILVVGLFILISALCVVAVYVILNYSKFSTQAPLPTATQMVVAAPIEEEVVPTATIQPSATAIPEPTATATLVPTATALVDISDRAINPENVNSLQIKLQEEYGDLFAKSLDGNRIAFVDGEVITIWNPMDGSQLFELIDHTADVVDLAFSDDGDHLVSAAEDFSVYLWNVRTGELAGRFVFDAEVVNQIRTVVGNRFPLDISVDYSPDGTTIAAGAFGIVNIFDIATRLTRGIYVVETDKLTSIAEDIDDLKGFDVQFNQNGWVLSAAMSGHLVGVDSLDATPLYQVDLAPLANIHYSDDRLIMLESDLGGVLFRTVETGEVYNGFDGVEEKTDQLAPIVGLSDKWDVIGIESNTTEGDIQLSVWQVSQDEHLADFPAVCQADECRNPVFDISPKGDWIAVETFEDNKTQVQLYDLVTEKELHQLSNFSSPVQSIAIAPTGELVAVLDQNGVLRVWDVDYGAQRVSLEADDMEKIEFSRDGRFLFGWNAESFIVWSLP